MSYSLFFFFFFNDTATTEIYTLSLHDALPICILVALKPELDFDCVLGCELETLTRCQLLCIGPVAKQSDGIFRYWTDRKSTRLNSSHLVISYAVFCLKKKKKYEMLAFRHGNRY